MILGASAQRTRTWFLDTAPAPVVKAIAQRLARGHRLGIEPGWRFDIGAEDTSQRARLRRELWAYYRDHDISEPVTFAWYERLRVRLFLGNDLSLCLYAGGSFEPNEFAFLAAVLRPGMVFLDGGANDGLYSLFASRRVAHDGVVVAVEPSSREFERLEANLELNSLTNVRRLKIAFGSEPGNATLAIAESGHEGQNTIGATVSNPTVKTTSHETVRVQTIDAMVAEQRLDRVDFIKLDVEGAELDALEGGRSTIERFQPLMLVEAEDERLASQNRTKQDLVGAIDELGYELWVFDRDTAQLRPARRPDEPEGNTVAAPKGWQPPVIA